MRLGIDFGTTRTVAVAVDSESYTIVSFKTGGEEMIDYYPSLVASRKKEWAFGLEALFEAYKPGWTTLRSIKRLLIDTRPDATISVGQVSETALELITRYMVQFKADIFSRSNLKLDPDEELEVFIAVPANASNNQRFLTMESFLRAGFHVLGMINEPSAAGFEYAHHYGMSTGRQKKEHLFIYDLGGGTFDACIVGRGHKSQEVVASAGINRLGGDDFDEILLQMALEQAGSSGDIPQDRRFFLLEECRRKKEALNPNSRKVEVGLGCGIEGGPTVSIKLDQYYERCAPLVEQTISAVETALKRAIVPLGWEEIASLYVVGGGSELPLVGRVLRERYGRRVRRSTYPFAATAVGLAIAADSDSGYSLRERFTRNFGVWREGEAGERITFDSIFPESTMLPAVGDPPLLLLRTYHPVHNIGHFRYLECGLRDAAGEPAGDIIPWDEVFFPFDPVLKDVDHLHRVPLKRSEAVKDQVIEERYQCGSDGILTVSIINVTSGYERSFHLTSQAR